jgi:hypothetical protein
MKMASSALSWEMMNMPG